MSRACGVERAQAGGADFRMGTVARPWSGRCRLGPDVVIRRRQPRAARLPALAPIARHFDVRRRVPAVGNCGACVAGWKRGGTGRNVSSIATRARREVFLEKKRKAYPLSFFVSSSSNPHCADFKYIRACGSFGSSRELTCSSPLPPLGPAFIRNGAV